MKKTHSVCVLWLASAHLIITISSLSLQMSDDPLRSSMRIFKKWPHTADETRRPDRTKRYILSKNESVQMKVNSVEEIKKTTSKQSVGPSLQADITANSIRQLEEILSKCRKTPIRGACQDIYIPHYYFADFDIPTEIDHNKKDFGENVIDAEEEAKEKRERQQLLPKRLYQSNEQNPDVAENSLMHPIALVDEDLISDIIRDPSVEDIVFIRKNVQNSDLEASLKNKCENAAKQLHILKKLQAIHDDIKQKNHQLSNLFSIPIPVKPDPGVGKLDPKPIPASPIQNEESLDIENLIENFSYSTLIPEYNDRSIESSENRKTIDPAPETPGPSTSKILPFPGFPEIPSNGDSPSNLASTTETPMDSTIDPKSLLITPITDVDSTTDNPSIPGSTTETPLDSTGDSKSLFSAPTTDADLTIVTIQTPMDSTGQLKNISTTPTTDTDFTTDNTLTTGSSTATPTDPTGDARSHSTAPSTGTESTTYNQSAQFSTTVTLPDVMGDLRSLSTTNNPITTSSNTETPTNPTKDPKSFSTTPTTGADSTTTTTDTPTNSTGDTRSLSTVSTSDADLTTVTTEIPQVSTGVARTPTTPTTDADSATDTPSTPLPTTEDTRSFSLASTTDADSTTATTEAPVGFKEDARGLSTTPNADTDSTTDNPSTTVSTTGDPKSLTTPPTVDADSTTDNLSTTVSTTGDSRSLTTLPTVDADSTTDNPSTTVSTTGDPRSLTATPTLDTDSTTDDPSTPVSTTGDSRSLTTLPTLDTDSTTDNPLMPVSTTGDPRSLTATPTLDTDSTTDDPSTPVSTTGDSRSLTTLPIVDADSTTDNPPTTVSTRGDSRSLTTTPTLDTDSTTDNPSTPVSTTEDPRSLTTLPTLDTDSRTDDSSTPVSTTEDPRSLITMPTLDTDSTTDNPSTTVSTTGDSRSLTTLPNLDTDSTTDNPSTTVSTRGDPRSLTTTPTLDTDSITDNPSTPGLTTEIPTDLTVDVRNLSTMPTTDTDSTADVTKRDTSTNRPAETLNPGAPIKLDLGQPSSTNDPLYSRVTPDLIADSTAGATTINIIYPDKDKITLSNGENTSPDLSSTMETDTSSEIPETKVTTQMPSAYSTLLPQKKLNGDGRPYHEEITISNSTKLEYETQLNETVIDDFGNDTGTKGVIVSPIKSKPGVVVSPIKSNSSEVSHVDVEKPPIYSDDLKALDVSPGENGTKNRPETKTGAPTVDPPTPSQPAKKGSSSPSKNLHKPKPGAKPATVKDGPISKGGSQPNPEPDKTDSVPFAVKPNAPERPSTETDPVDPKVPSLPSGDFVNTEPAEDDEEKRDLSSTDPTTPGIKGSKPVINLDSKGSKPGISPDSKGSKPGVDTDDKESIPAIDPDNKESKPSINQDNKGLKPSLKPDKNGAILDIESDKKGSKPSINPDTKGSYPGINPDNNEMKPGIDPGKGTLKFPDLPKIDVNSLHNTPLSDLAFYMSQRNNSASAALKDKIDQAFHHAEVNLPMDLGPLKNDESDGDSKSLTNDSKKISQKELKNKIELAVPNAIVADGLLNTFFIILLSNNATKLNLERWTEDMPAIEVDDLCVPLYENGIVQDFLSITRLLKGTVYFKNSRSKVPIRIKSGAERKCSSLNKYGILKKSEGTPSPGKQTASADLGTFRKQPDSKSGPPPQSGSVPSRGMGPDVIPILTIGSGVPFQKGPTPRIGSVGAGPGGEFSRELNLRSGPVLPRDTGRNVASNLQIDPGIHFPKKTDHRSGSAPFGGDNRYVIPILPPDRKARLVREPKSRSGPAVSAQKSVKRSPASKSDRKRIPREGSAPFRESSSNVVGNWRVTLSPSERNAFLERFFKMKSRINKELDSFIEKPVPFFDKSDFVNENKR